MVVLRIMIPCFVGGVVIESDYPNNQSKQIDQFSFADTNTHTHTQWLLWMVAFSSLLLLLCCIVQMAILIRKIVMFIYYHHHHRLLFFFLSWFSPVSLVQWLKYFFLFYGVLLCFVCVMYLSMRVWKIQFNPPFFLLISMLYIQQTELTLANKPTLPSVLFSFNSFLFYFFSVFCCCLYFPWSSHGIAYNNRSISFFSGGTRLSIYKSKLKLYSSSFFVVVFYRPFGVGRAFVLSSKFLVVGALLWH